MLEGDAHGHLAGGLDAEPVLFARADPGVVPVAARERGGVALGRAAGRVAAEAGRRRLHGSAEGAVVGAGAGRVDGVLGHVALGAGLVLAPGVPLAGATERLGVGLPAGVAVGLGAEDARGDAHLHRRRVRLLLLGVVHDDAVHRGRAAVPAAGARLLVDEGGEDVVLEGAVGRVDGGAVHALLAHDLVEAVERVLAADARRAARRVVAQVLARGLDGQERDVAALLRREAAEDLLEAGRARRDGLVVGVVDEVLAVGRGDLVAPAAVAEDGAAPALQAAAEGRVGLAVAALARAAGGVGGEARAGPVRVLPDRLAARHRAARDGHLERVLRVARDPHDRHHVADAAALPALEQHVAGGDRLGAHVEHVRAVREVGAAEVEEQQAHEVADALVEEDLVEVGARAHFAAVGREELDRVVVAEAVSAQPAVARPRLTRAPVALVVAVAAAEGGELADALTARVDEAEVADVERLAALAVPALHVERQVVPAREGGAQEVRDLGALEGGRVEAALAVGGGHDEGLTRAVVAILELEARDPEVELLFPVEARVLAPGHAGSTRGGGVRVRPRVRHRPDLGGHAGRDAGSARRAPVVLPVRRDLREGAVDAGLGDGLVEGARRAAESEESEERDGTMKHEGPPEMRRGKLVHASYRIQPR